MVKIQMGYTGRSRLFDSLLTRMVFFGFFAGSLGPQALALAGVQTKSIETQIAKPPTPHNSGIAADLSGAYSWGTYSSPGEADDTHSGPSLRALLGYRFE